MGNDTETDIVNLVKSWAGAGLDAAMDFRYVHASRDEVVIEYDVDEKHLQPYGIVHGGVHCAAVEVACACSAWMPAAISLARRSRPESGAEVEAGEWRPVTNCATGARS